MLYRAVLSDQAVGFLRGLTGKDRKVVDDKIQLLREDPYRAPSEQLTQSRFRKMRAGNYRILYEAHVDVQVLDVDRIDHRSRVYGGH